MFECGGKNYLQGLEAGPWLLWKFLRDLGQECQLQISPKGDTNFLFSVTELFDMKGRYQARRQQPLYTVNNELSKVKLDFKPEVQEEQDLTGQKDPEEEQQDRDTSKPSTTPKTPQTPRSSRSSSDSDPDHQAGIELPSHVLVIDDSEGGLFRSENTTPEIPKNSSVVFYQTRCPEKLGSDESPALCKLSDEDSLKELFIIIDVEDLRNNGISISRNLSWEKAAADTVENFKPEKFLQNVPNTKWTKIKWIIRFGDAGVIVLQKSAQQTNAHLYFDPEKGESDFSQEHSPNPVALDAAFLGGLVFKAMQEIHNNERSEKNPIEAGLCCARYLFNEGTVKASDTNDSIEYPKLTFGEAIQLQDSDIPGSNFDEWSILKDTHDAKDKNETSSAKMLELGTRIAKEGIKIALSTVPTAQFGNIFTADKSEVESFHRISNRVEEYLKEAENFYSLSNGEKSDLNTTRKKPLSIGVFGKPGSGKSFVIKQIIEEITKKIRHGKINKYPDLYWNLSQFLDYSNLLVAFQTVRDKTVSGQVPIVCFDEFDTSLNGELGWLKFFLAPMQDGEFFDQGQSRPIGHAIFIFIGGTRFTYEEFQNDKIQFIPSGSINTSAEPSKEDNSYSKNQKEKAEKAARAVKLPDFVSRLHRHLDIQGYDKPSDRDPVYIIRRAILIRSKLKERGLELTGKEELKEEEIPTLDDSMLNKILIADSYKHGARTIDNIFKGSKITDGKLHLNPLPSDEVVLPTGESSQTAS